MPMFSSKSFMVPGLTFGSIIHFNIIINNNNNNCSELKCIKYV